MSTGSRTGDKIHDALVEQIVAGAIQPGALLSEAALAERFSASRTPVREALSRLHQAQLVERGPRRAFVVRSLQPSDLAELFEAVGEVEAALAAMAALRMSEVHRQVLLSALEEGDGAGGAPEAYGAANARFHRVIRDGAQNSVLATTLDELDLRTLPWRAAQFKARHARLETSRAEHRAIVAAIIDRNPDDARELMRRHIATTFLTLSDILNVRNKQSRPSPPLERPRINESTD